MGAEEDGGYQDQTRRPSRNGLQPCGVHLHWGPGADGAGKAGLVFRRAGLEREVL